MMQGARRRLFRRSGALLLATSVAAIAMGSGRGHHSSAAADTTSFGSFSLSATARGMDISEDRPGATTHPEGQGSVPETSTVLSPGLGFGLSTVVWPGPLAGNAGSLLQLLAPTGVGGVPIPDAITQSVYPNLTAANDPVRAEARSGSNPDSTYAVPGTTLAAHADTNKVNAVASVNGAEQPGFATYGNIHTEALSDLTDNGATGEATATSTVQNITFGAVIKIGSVTSKATAKTNGTTGDASGSTVVHDMTVAGQKATVDDSGVHIGDQSQPANAIADQIAQQALASSGFKMYVSTPTVEKSGARASYTAGSLIITGTPNGSDSSFVVILGGARADVTAAPGFDVASTDTGSSAVTPVATTPSSSPTASSSSGVVPATTGTATPPSSSVDTAAPATTAPVAAGGSTQSAPVTQPASDTSTPFGGVGVGWVLVGLAGAGLLGAGFKRATDDILERAATACPLEP